MIDFQNNLSFTCQVIASVDFSRSIFTWDAAGCEFVVRDVIDSGGPTFDDLSGYAQQRAAVSRDRFPAFTHWLTTTVHE